MLVGCHPSPAPPKLPSATFTASVLIDVGLETKTSAADPKWVLSTPDPRLGGALVWTGSTGVLIGPFGVAASSDGSSLNSYADGHYDAKEDIQPLVSPFNPAITVNDQPVHPLSEGYSQTFDLRHNLLTTHWFAPAKGGFLEARLTTFGVGPSIAARWEFHGPVGLKVQVAEDHKLQNSGWDLAHGELINGSKLGAPLLQLPYDGVRQRVTATTAIAIMPPEGLVWVAEAHGPLLGPRTGGYDVYTGGSLADILRRIGSNRQAERATIEIEGPAEDQVAVNSFAAYLEQVQQFAPQDWNPESAARFSPFGLSSNRYNGHVFWDADVWLMPALSFIDPGILQDLANYRLSHLQDKPSAPFPWESSVTGKETAPGDSKKEVHITGSVLWGLEFEKALGANVPDSIVTRVANYYVARGSKRPDGKVGILDVMSPDESHIGSNDLYTNLVAQWAINGATWRPATKPAVSMFLPADATTFLTYDNDPVRSYKQAAAVLAVYPLQYPPAEAQAKAMLERFQDKVIKNGPAMTDSVHATIWARLGEADTGYKLWRKSWSEFVKGPFLLFSEKRSSPTTYFTTGAAGCLQSVIYGFMGFRVDEQPEAGAAWKLQLKNHRWLSIKPHLPSAWKSITFRHFHVLNRTYTLTVKREGSKTVTSVTQGV